MISRESDGKVFACQLEFQRIGNEKVNFPLKVTFCCFFFFFFGLIVIALCRVLSLPCWIIFEYFPFLFLVEKQ